MKKVDDFIYEVAHDESVTLVFTPVGVAPSMVTVSLDGQPLLPNPASPNPTFRFVATKLTGHTHFCKAECNFPQGVDDTAPDPKFDVEISGSPSTVSFNVSIKKSDAIHDPTFQFEVV